MKCLVSSLFLAASAVGASCASSAARPEPTVDPDAALPGVERPDAAAPQAGADTDTAPFRSAESDSGLFTVRWRPLAPEVPNNVPFEIELQLEQDGQPVTGAKMFMRAWMPDHGHGMLRKPVVEELGGGRYLVRGVLLHMGGFWQVFFDVYKPDGRKERTRFDLSL